MWLPGGCKSWSHKKRRELQLASLLRHWHACCRNTKLKPRPYGRVFAQFVSTTPKLASFQEKQLLRVNALNY